MALDICNYFYTMGSNIVTVVRAFLGVAMTPEKVDDISTGLTQGKE